MDRLRRVALTGGIATGKSHVRARFEALGVPTIDADVLARQAVAPGTPGFGAVVERFGPAILDPRGGIDRRTLAAIVFADPDARRDLERIIHPVVQRETDAWFATIDPARHRWALADIPLLYEVGREVDYDTVIVAACDPDTQVRRVVHRDRVTEAEARRRIAAQLPIADKVRRADHVVYTDGTFDETNAQIDALYRTLSNPHS